jgi:HEAT repeat protein
MPPFLPPLFPEPPDLSPPPVPPSREPSPRPTRGKIVPDTLAEAVEFLMGNDEVRQQQAVSFLAYREFEGPDADVADALFQYLDSRPDGDRFAAASALRKWASATDLERLAPLLEDENVLVQTHVAETIGLLGTTEAAEVLAARLTDRRSASRVFFPLRKMGEVAEQPVLAVLGNSDLDRGTLSQVIHILGDIGGRDSLAALQRIAGDQDHPGRLTARLSGRKIERRLAE